MFKFRPVIIALITGVVSFALGIGLTRQHYVRIAREENVANTAVSSQISFGLLSMIDGGREEKAKHFLEGFLLQDLQLFQEHQNAPGEEGRMAREALKRASDWRKSHPGVTLDPSLEQELQKVLAKFPNGAT